MGRPDRSGRFSFGPGGSGVALAGAQFLVQDFSLGHVLLGQHADHEAVVAVQDDLLEGGLQLAFDFGHAGEALDRGVRPLLAHAGVDLAQLDQAAGRLLGGLLGLGRRLDLGGELRGQLGLGLGQAGKQRADLLVFHLLRRFFVERGAILADLDQVGNAAGGVGHAALLGDME